jgi:hypothetical protein
MPEAARARLQTNFGMALLAARGDTAPETLTAFARAQELAAAVDDPMERISANYGLWVGYLSRGEVGPLRAIAEVVLRDIEGKPPSPEAAVARRLAGVTEWYLGNFRAGARPPGADARNVRSAARPSSGLPPSGGTRAFPRWCLWL